MILFNEQKMRSPIAKISLSVFLLKYLCLSFPSVMNEMTCDNTFAFWQREQLVLGDDFQNLDSNGSGSCSACTYLPKRCDLC